MIISDGDRWKYLINKIFNAQILLDRLKSAVKIGEANIKNMRLERDSLRTTQNHGSGKVRE